MLMPPEASTMLANWSKLSDTACWIGIPKSSSIAATSWVMPSNSPASTLLPRAAGVGDEQVAGDREQRQAVVGRVGVEDHDHVAVDPVHPLRAQPVGRILDLQRTARRGADHQDVLGAVLLASAKCTAQAIHLDPGKVVRQR